MIKVSVIGGTAFEGEVYAIDPVTKSIAIKDDKGAFTVVNPSQIAQISGDLSSIKVPELSKLGVSLAAIEKKEDAAWRLAENRIAALNSNVEVEIQALFDRVNFVYPCKWSGSSIIVLDEYIINSPYEHVHVIKGCDGSGIERVKKILDGERKKLNLI